MISLRSLHTLLPEMDTKRRDALCYLIHGWSLAVLNQGLANRAYSAPQGPVFEDTEETDTITVADEVFLAIVPWSNMPPPPPKTLNATSPETAPHGTISRRIALAA